jgi:hypothetical protein
LILAAESSTEPDLEAGLAEGAERRGAMSVWAVGAGTMGDATLMAAQPGDVRCIGTHHVNTQCWGPSTSWVSSQARGERPGSEGRAISGFATFPRRAPSPAPAGPIRLVIRRCAPRWGAAGSARAAP